MRDLWHKLEPWVSSGREARKVELKREWDLGPRPNRTRLAQLVTAMANTPGGVGYIVIGVLDRRQRPVLQSGGAPGLADVVCGIDHDSETFERQLQQALADASDPVPSVRYEVLDVPDTGKRIGVIVVELSAERPHELIRDSEGIRRGCYVRRGAETFPATREDLRAMFDAASAAAVLINFAHPVTAEQLDGLRTETGIWVAEVIKVDVHFDEDCAFADQVSAIVDAAGLTEDDWQTLPLIVNVPGFAYIAAALIAEIHGRAGYFPNIMRLRRSPQDSTKFLFAELIRLQDIRHAARLRR
jgi:hypothetical protein